MSFHPGHTSEHRRINIVQGECHVSGDNDLSITTLLGSCVAACINDPVFGLVGFTATAATGTITLAYNGDITVTGTARNAGTVTTVPGSRKVRVKLGY